MALTTLEKVKSFVLGAAAGGTTHNARLTALQASVEAAIESFCKRQFAQVTETVILNGSGRNALRLPRWPVTAVTSVRIDLTGAFGDGTELTFADYFILDGDAGLIRRRYKATWPDEPACVRVVYTGGYATIPDDLQQCVAEAVADRWHRSRQSESGAPAQMQASESINFMGSATFQNELSQDSPFPISVERILRSKYRVPF